jgi:Tfp pilus assembly protein PilV
VTAAVDIGLRRVRPSRLAAKLRGEDGIGLIELLIALLVLNVGIFATLGAFTSAATTIRRASHISTAAAIADQEVEALHNAKYDTGIVTQAAFTWPSAQTPDGRTYSVQVDVTPGRQVTGVTYQGSAFVKEATVTVYDGAATDPNKTLLVKSMTTFSRCTQAGLGTTPDQASTACQN